MRRMKSAFADNSTWYSSGFEFLRFAQRHCTLQTDNATSYIDKKAQITASCTSIAHTADQGHEEAQQEVQKESVSIGSMHQTVSVALLHLGPTTGRFFVSLVGIVGGNSPLHAVGDASHKLQGACGGPNSTMLLLLVLRGGVSHPLAGHATTLRAEARTARTDPGKN